MPLRTVLERLEREHPGQVLDVELEDEDGRLVYEVKLLQSDGQLVKLEARRQNRHRAAPQGTLSRPPMRILLVEDDPTLRAQLRTGPARGRLRGGRGRQRPRRALSGRHRSLRRGGARPRPAGARRPERAQALARRGPSGAGADPDRARQLEREGGRHRRRCRRLPHQTFPHGRAAGAPARADPPRRRPGLAGAAVRRAGAGHAQRPRHAAGPDRWR